MTNNHGISDDVISSHLSFAYLGNIFFEKLWIFFLKTKNLQAIIIPGNEFLICLMTFKFNLQHV